VADARRLIAARGRRELHQARGTASSAAVKQLHLNFSPRSADLALLLIRLWFGLSMLLLHGWGKLSNFGPMLEKFSDPIGIGKTASLVLATTGEALCAALVVIGLFTRVAALGVGSVMAVAFWFAHGHKLSGPGSGEMAFLFLGAFLALFIAGGGKYSVDAQIGAKS
jgi:putative oxidoreductase